MSQNTKDEEVVYTLILKLENFKTGTVVLVKQCVNNPGLDKQRQRFLIRVEEKNGEHETFWCTDKKAVDELLIEHT